jgi:hypothetical protein
MNEFLIIFSDDHSFLWALLIIGVIGTSAVVLHFFWTALFRAVDALRGQLSKNSKGGH